jgi:hypothetical protein
MEENTDQSISHNVIHKQYVCLDNDRSTNQLVSLDASFFIIIYILITLLMVYCSQCTNSKCLQIAKHRY